MNERLKASIILLLICMCGVIIPQSLNGIMNEDWAKALSLISIFGAIVAFLCAFVIIFQDMKNEGCDEEEEG